jgi:rubrerythrin
VAAGPAAKGAARISLTSDNKRRNDAMPNASRFSTPDKILKAALSKEKRARDFYADQIGRCRIEMVRELLEKLRNEEQKHVRMVEQMMANLRLGRNVV